MSRLALRLALSLMALAFTREASAQDVVVLVADGISARERDAIATALHEELGLEVREEASVDALTLRISAREGSAQLAVDRPGRARTERAVVLPHDPDARLHTLVTLAVNLTRDEAAELLARMRRADEETSAAERPAAAPETGTTETQAIDAGARETRGEPVEAATAAPAAQDPWRHRLVRLGAGAHLGTAPEVGGGVVPWTLYGVDLVVAPIPELALGVRDLGAVGDGRAVVLNVGPVVEAALRVLPPLDLHAILGCDLQVPLHEAGGMGAAPRLGVGARFYPVPIFSIALDVTGRVVATDAFHTAATILPSGAVLLTVGLSFAFHLG